MKSDAQLYVARLNPKATLEYVFTQEGFGWLQVVRGGLTANHISLQRGDALAISLEENLTIVATEEAELPLFDLP
jgi:redox-sensitive bicupin YhaK (pirin superfamily)